mmetsp:Transcript_26472/g.76443  ORF Transcript_26472/g.76443 Transcript_26472/m.76443 type:complete len:275 (-) Transcript_26472:1546-2370(-)
MPTHDLLHTYGRSLALFMLPPPLLRLLELVQSAAALCTAAFFQSPQLLLQSGFFLHLFELRLLDFAVARDHRFLDLLHLAEFFPGLEDVLLCERQRTPQAFVVAASMLAGLMRVVDLSRFGRLHVTVCVGVVLPVTLLSLLRMMAWRSLCCYGRHAMACRRRRQTHHGRFRFCRRWSFRLAVEHRSRGRAPSHCSAHVGGAPYPTDGVRCRLFRWAAEGREGCATFDVDGILLAFRLRPMGRRRAHGPAALVRPVGGTPHLQIRGGEGLCGAAL